MKKVPPWVWIVAAVVVAQWMGVIDLPVVRDVVDALRGAL